MSSLIRVYKNRMNAGLVSAVRFFIHAEAYRHGANRFFFLAAGISLLILLAGAGVSIAIKGWKSLQKHDDYKELGEILKSGLSDVRLSARATGDVNLKSDPLILEKDALVSLAPDATIRLAEGGEIRVKGDIEVIVPFPQRAHVSTPSRHERVVTTQPTFTIFKAVPYKGGSIITGWTYFTQAQSRPSEQYCYYSERLTQHDTRESFQFATNGQVDRSLRPPASLNVPEAFTYCVWFD